MADILEIIRKYSEGAMDAVEANEQLREQGAPFHLSPGRNIITEDEKRATTVGYYPEQANGFGLLDTGTGSLDKVRVKDGQLVNCDCGEMYALLSIAGKTYHVKGRALTE